MVALPRNNTSVPRALVCDALHFRRGIHNLRVLDVEALIEIPVKSDGKPDLDFVRELWWAGITLIRQAQGSETYPIRVALEMRLMGGSQTILAGQYGNKYTCAIEVLSFLENQDEFLHFAEQLVDTWYQLSKERNLKFRLHWSKQWTKVNGMDYIDYVKSDMSAELVRFKNQVPVGAWQVFSNPTFNKLFDISVPPTSTPNPTPIATPDPTPLIPISTPNTPRSTPNNIPISTPLKPNTKPKPNPKPDPKPNPKPNPKPQPKPNPKPDPKPKPNPKP
jgi:hypothetical protein